MKQIYPNTPIFKEKDEILVESSAPGKTHGEDIRRLNSKEYRVWNPFRSKLGAAVAVHLKEFPIQPGTKVLYLGIAQGQSATYVADVVGPSGVVYGIEFAERAVRDLLPVCEKRPNIIPILGDARMPEQYEMMVETVDVVFCDIADPQATKVAIRNCERFLKPKGYFMLSVKTRSVDVTKRPKQIVEEESRFIEQSGFRIIDVKMLDPFEDDHGFILAQKL